MKWEVVNSMFIGLVLCDKKSDMDLERLGVKVEAEEHWFPMAIDLRSIISIRQYGEEENTKYSYLEGDHVAYVVNAPYDELLHNFISSRSLPKPVYR